MTISKPKILMLLIVITFLILSTYYSNPKRQRIFRRFMPQLEIENPDTIDYYPEGKIPPWILHWELAEVLGFDDKFPAAIIEYQKAIELNPQLIKLKIALASLLYWDKQNQKAYQIINTLDISELNAADRLLAAKIIVGNGKYEQALPILAEYLKNNPIDQQARAYYADVLSWNKQYSLAIQQYKQILDHRPYDIQVRRHLARILRWNGQFQEAADELRKTLKPYRAP
ncbi:MAG: tetratricopeptide repeat protein [Chlamydiota bacterium]